MSRVIWSGSVRKVIEKNVLPTSTRSLPAQPYQRIVPWVGMIFGSASLGPVRS
ncbi:MAG TPA: hypothetical protein VE891_14455 [Allosphingosinicella sp.]|nr:hypothetical protein [Allosphingosinicella sp.]